MTTARKPNESPRRHNFRWRLGLSVLPAVGLLTLACWLFALVACKAPGHR